MMSWKPPDSASVGSHFSEIASDLSRIPNRFLGMPNNHRFLGLQMRPGHIGRRHHRRIRFDNETAGIGNHSSTLIVLRVANTGWTTHQAESASVKTTGRRIAVLRGCVANVGRCSVLGKVQIEQLR